MKIVKLGCNVVHLLTNYVHFWWFYKKLTYCRAVFDLRDPRLGGKVNSYPKVVEVSPKLLNTPHMYLTFTIVRPLFLSRADLLQNWLLMRTDSPKSCKSLWTNAIWNAGIVYKGKRCTRSIYLLLPCAYPSYNQMKIAFAIESDLNHYKKWIYWRRWKCT